MARKGWWLVVVGVMAFPAIAAAQQRVGGVSPTGQPQTRIINRVAATTSGTMSQRIQEREELKSQFRERLQLIKDERKQALLEKIQTRMCTINLNRTEIMGKHLDRMLQILVRVEEKAATLSAAGKNIQPVTAAVKTAEEKIDAARIAVTTQSMLECDIEITGSLKTLGSEVRNSISDLQKELSAVNEKVREAKRAVSEAIVALAHSMGNPLPTKAAGD